MRQILCQLALLYEVTIIARVILSWFPLKPGTLMSRINDILMSITEPVLGRLRRVLPSTGFLDLSPLVAILAIEIVIRRIILQC
jgi:YggT family protein